MSQVFEFAARRALDRCIAQIEAAGWTVSVVEDHGSWLLVDAFDAADVGGEVFRMVIDPERNRRERAERRARLMTR